MAYSALIALAVLAGTVAAHIEEDDLVEDLLNTEGVETPEEIEAFWTEEMMASAIPLDTPTVDEDDVQEFDFNDDVVVYTEEAVPGEGDDESWLSTIGSFMSSASDADGDDTDPDGDWLQADGPNPVRRANVRIRPYKTGGKMFFTKPNGRRYSCSAQFVGRTKIVLSAAHCVIDGNGKWYRNKMFYRAYSNGGGQSISIIYTILKTAYISPAGPAVNYGYDYTFMISRQSSRGGAQGLKTGLPYRAWHSIGYPSNFDSGRYMQVTWGHKGGRRGKSVEMRNNQMGPGCSGGSWIGSLATGNHRIGRSNYAISVNSHRFRSQPHHLWGPYFDGITWRLYVKVRTKVDSAAKVEAYYYYGTRAAGAGALAALAIAGWRARKKRAEYEAVPSDEEATSLL